MPLLMIILFLAAIVGVALLILGVRGRRVDDHPICRRCGFDLVGLPEGVTTCSECGADLEAKRAVVHGRRKRRPVLAVAGAIPILAVMGIIALGTWSRATQFDLNRMKPTAWLMHEARVGGGSSNSVAWAELI